MLSLTLSMCACVDIMWSIFCCWFFKANGFFSFWCEQQSKKSNFLFTYQSKMLFFAFTAYREIPSTKLCFLWTCFFFVVLKANTTSFLLALMMTQTRKKCHRCERAKKCHYSVYVEMINFEYNKMNETRKKTEKSCILFADAG